jgi:hypothetical protein
MPEVIWAATLVALSLQLGMGVATFAFGLVFLADVGFPEAALVIPLVILLAEYRSIWIVLRYFRLLELTWLLLAPRFALIFPILRHLPSSWVVVRDLSLDDLLCWNLEITASLFWYHLALFKCVAILLRNRLEATLSGASVRKAQMRQ